MGTGANRGYVDGRTICYDQVDSLTWSPLMVEKIVEEIGYEMTGRMKIWYCNPLLTLSTGLRETRDDHDTQMMISLVDIGKHFFSLYIDHDQAMSSNNLDDVVHHPIASLPTVISPSKPSSSKQPEVLTTEVVDSVDEAIAVPIQVVYAASEEHNSDFVGTRTRQSKRKRSNTEPVIEVTDNDDADDSDFDCVDSYNDVSDGDDDIYADNR